MWHICYNVLNKTADTIEQTYPFPANLSVTRNSTSKLARAEVLLFYTSNIIIKVQKRYRTCCVSDDEKQDMQLLGLEIHDKLIIAVSVL